jgi:hypothetical protein
MRVCGVDLKASDAIVVVLDGTVDNFEVVDTGVQKITLGDSNSSEDIQSFNETFHSFIKNHTIDKVGIKKRNTRGQFAGGATSFKIEGIIQLSKDSTVVLIAPASISSTVKKTPPPTVSQLFAYQKSSYETAYTLLRSL